MFWCVFIAGLISGYVRLTCLPLWEVGYYGVAVFPLVMAIGVGVITAWEPYALRGALLMGTPFIAIGYIASLSHSLDPAGSYSGYDLTASFFGVVGIMFAYFGACMALHIRGHQSLSTRLLWTPPIAALVIANLAGIVKHLLT